MAEMASSTSYSDLSNVLKMIAKEFKQFSVFDLTKSNMILVISVAGSNEYRELLKPHVFHAWNSVN